MVDITVKNILEATGGVLLCGDENTVLTDICINSKEAKEGDQVPEGQIQAGEQGQSGDQQKEQQMREMEMADQKPDDRTGFSKNEARALLRTYNDQMQLQFQQRRRENSVKRDW